MAGYIGSRAAVVSSGAERKNTFTITGTTTVLSGLSYTPTFVHVFHNGVRLVDGTDYTATNSTSITLTTAAENGDEIVVISYATFQVADAYTKAEADAGFVSDPNGAVTVDASGNVGIGTATPTGSLDVARSGSHEVVFRTTSTGDPTLNLQADGTNNGKISYVRATEGLTFSNGGSERMRIDSAGRVTTPYQPAFDVSYSGSGYTTVDTVVFDTVYTNVGGHYNTSNGRFTAPVSGSYIFYTSYIKNNNTAVARRRFDKNGSRANNNRHLRLDSDQPFGDNGVMQALIYLNVNDYVTVDHYAGSSYGTIEYDYFGGYLIG